PLDLGTHGIHGWKHFVHAVLEQIADEQIGEMTFEMGMTADELAEAETVVIFAYQATHAVHALDEARPPLAQLSRGSVALLKSFDHGVGRQGAGLERQQHSR